MKDERDWHVNWIGVALWGALTMLVFGLGLLVGILLNDSSLVTELQTIGQIVLGIGLGMGIASFVFREVLRGDDDER